MDTNFILPFRCKKEDDTLTSGVYDPVETQLELIDDLKNSMIPKYFEKIKPRIFKEWIGIKRPFLCIGAVYNGSVYEFCNDIVLEDFFDAL